MMMKRLLSLCTIGLMLVSSQVFGQATATISPKYGCPNTNDIAITITVTNTSGFSIPGGIAYTIDLTLKTDGGVTIQTFNQTYTDGWTNNTSKVLVMNDVDFVGAMTCPVTGSISATLPFPIGAQSFPINTSYIVQYPGDLTITENPAGTLEVTTPLDGYSVNFYKDANYTTVDHTTTGTTYAVTTDGSYTAKAYDPITECISPNPSNAVVIVLTSTYKASDVQVDVYPNPVVSTIVIETPAQGAFEYVLHDTNGKTISTGSFSGSTEVDASHIKAGTYVLTIKQQNKVVSSYKLVK